MFTLRTDITYQGKLIVWDEMKGEGYVLTEGGYSFLVNRNASEYLLEEGQDINYTISIAATSGNITVEQAWPIAA